MDNTEPKSILVLGASGRLGRLLRAAWSIRPPIGVELFFQSRGALPGANTIHWAPGDDLAALPACDVVIALWGRTSGEADALADNIALADHSRTVAQACGASLAFHFSSAAVYGPAAGASERDAPNPVNAYGRSKLDMEARVATYEDTGLRHTALRLANVVGADSLAPALKALGPVILDQFEDELGPLRSYIGAFDLSQVLMALAALPTESLPNVLNVAAHKPVWMQDLARAAQKKIQWRPAPPEAVQEVTMQTEILRQLSPRIVPTADAATLMAQLKAQEALTEL